MLQSHLVLIEVVADIIHGLAVDPSPTEEAGSLALLLAHDLSAVHTVVNQVVPRALAVAGLPPGDQEFRHVLDNLMLSFDFFSVFSTFNLFLLVFNLLLIFPYVFYSLYELNNILLGLLMCEVQEITQLLIDTRSVLLQKSISIFVTYM